MSIATDPNLVDNDDQQDEFEAEFKRLAEGKDPSPRQENEPEPAPSEGNDAEEDNKAPAEEHEPEAATEGSPPEETVTSDEAKPEDGGQPSEGDTAPDPWADATPEQIAERDRLLRERDEALHRASSDANRVAALGRKLQKLTETSVAAASVPSRETEEAARALADKVKQLREDYGDIADPLIQLIEQQGRELRAVRQTQEVMTEQQQAQHIAAEAAALEMAHPDWRHIAQSGTFRGWLEVQPENIQRLATSWDARETSVVLTLFKAEQIEATGGMGQPSGQAQSSEAERAAQTATAATGERRSQQLEGGRAVRSRPTPAASGPPDDFEAAFKYFENKRREQAQARTR